MLRRKKDRPVASAREIINCHPEWDAEQLKTFLKSFCETSFENMRKQPVLQWMGKSTLMVPEPNVFEISAGPEIKGTFRIGEDPTKGRYIQLDWEKRSERAGWVWEGFIETLQETFAAPLESMGAEVPAGPVDSVKQIIICHPEWTVEQLKVVLKDIIITTLENLSKKSTLQWVGENAAWVKLEPNVFQTSSGSEIKGTFRIGEDPAKGRYVQLDWEKITERAGWIWEPIIKSLTETFGAPLPKQR